MTHEDLQSVCAALPGTDVSEPFGPGLRVWKVGGKIFVMSRADDGVRLKCADADTAALLIDVGAAEKAAYLPRGGWVMIRWGTMPPDELRERVLTSYLTVRRSLTRKAQAALGPEPVLP